MNLKRIFPFLEWARRYNVGFFRGDLAAGLTVGVMLVPQGMAYAMIAGLPAHYGLFAAMAPLIVYALFGTSRQLAVGPVALVSLLTAAAVGKMAPSGSEAYVQMAIMLAFVVGVIHLFMGVFRLGYLVNFLSHPVISGFTSAAAVIIALGQVKHILGIQLPRGLKIYESIPRIVRQIPDVNVKALGIGLAGIGLILLAKRIKRMRVPGSLLAVVFGILAVVAFGFTADDLALVGKIPSQLPRFKPVPVTWALFKELLPVAGAIAIVGFMESYAVAKALQHRHKDYKVVAGQELIALGMANIVGSFFQSYTVEGGFGRSAVNDQAGAKTPLAGVISSVVVMLALLFLTPVFYYLPKAILGAIVIVAVVGLIDVKEAKKLWVENQMDFAMWMVTFWGTLLLGVEPGIALGVFLSLAMVLFRTTRPHVAVLGNVPGTHFYRNVKRFDNLITKDDVLIIRFDAQLFFANVNYFRDKVDELIENKGEGLRLVVLCFDSINNLDSTAAHVIKDMVEEYASKGIEIAFTGVKGPVRDALSRAKILSEHTGDHFFMSIQEAIDCYEHNCISDPHKKGIKHADYIMQSNKD